MILRYADIIKTLQNDDFAGVYLFYGEEPFYTDRLVDFLEENTIDEDLRSFNQVVLYGRDVSVISVINQCRRFPMMGNKQLVLVREAQDMDMRKDESVTQLLQYLEKPSDFTILVLGFKYKNPSVKLINAIAKSKVFVASESKKKYDNEIPAWVAEYAREQGYSINTKACSMLVDFLGNNLEKIANELNKLFINHPREKPITDDVIERNIGISKDYNIFELTKAFSFRDVAKANAIVRYFELNPKENPMPKIIPVLFGYFSKLLLIHSLPDKSDSNIAAAIKTNSFFVREYIQAARNYPPDKLMKIISDIRETSVKAMGIDNQTTSEGYLLKELVFKILH